MTRLPEEETMDAEIQFKELFAEHPREDPQCGNAATSPEGCQQVRKKAVRKKAAGGKGVLKRPAAAASGDKTCAVPSESGPFNTLVKDVLTNVAF